MQIQSITNYRISSNYSITPRQCNCTFKADLWQDDYVSGSIFDLQDKQEKAHEIATSDFISLRNNVGYPVTREPLAKTKINSLRFIGNNTYKGGMTDAVEYINEIKDTGIKKMIVLCDPKECNIAQACKDNDMEWTNIFVPLNMDAEKGESNFEKAFNWNRFIDIVKSLREGNVFIGCESGNIRTKRFLHTVKLLDPQFKLDLGTSDSESYDYLLANWIYKGLSNVQKQALNYTSDFQRNLEREFQLYIPMKFRHVL